LIPNWVEVIACFESPTKAGTGNMIAQGKNRQDFANCFGGHVNIRALRLARNSFAPPELRA